MKILALIEIDIKKLMATNDDLGDMKEGSPPPSDDDVMQQFINEIGWVEESGIIVLDYKQVPAETSGLLEEL